MKYLDLAAGRRIEIPESAEEWLALQPEAKLREYFAGDERGMARYNLRVLDLELRFDLWQAKKRIAARFEAMHS
jgi:hypothetical protein